MSVYWPCACLSHRGPIPFLAVCYGIEYACQQVNSGVSAIFGPQNPLLGSHIQSLCDALDIPHIEARLDVESEEKEFSINLYPSPWLLGRAIRDLTKYLNWTKVAIIYEDDTGK
ncbi:hypothetical protein AVEN_116796-1 [Araneus ventricosus]|uniref:Receptor ligand binding region domain-containing protein n=1 Tax=Araneus ventricosus TaxID=182803 RepID=A0A4Y2S6Y1_ARAVE|nr:hypothetical protein AVEN_116796-1 [Araneus ventricosus]